MQCAAPLKLIPCIVLAVGLPANGDNNLGDCAPECRGECFAGHCLFSATELGEIPASVSVSLPMTPNAVAPRAPAVRAVAENPVRTPADITPNAVSARSPVSMAMQQPSFPVYGSQPLSGLAANADSTWKEWQAAEAENSQLLRENALLRQQLSNWHQLGLKIASRETQTAAFLAAEAKRRGGSRTGGLQLIQNGQTANATALEQTFNEVPRSAILSIEVLAILVIVYAMYQGRAFAIAVGQEGQPLLHKPAGAGRPGSFACLATPLRSTAKRLGLVEYQVEIGELMLGNICSSCGTLSVHVKIGATGQIFNTHGVSACGSSGNFLAFNDEVFQAKIRRMGGPCVFSVIDHDTPMKDCIAMAQVPAATLIDLAMQRQDYFQVELTEGPWRQEGLMLHASDTAQANRQPPILAMRLRDAGVGSSNAFAAASSSTLRDDEINRGRKQARPNRVDWPHEDEDDYVVRA